jgi:outer membrane protein assembly factor BamB
MSAADSNGFGRIALACELWSSGDQIATFNHFTSLSVANGRVYIGTYDGYLYCFGLDAAVGTK